MPPRANVPRRIVQPPIPALPYFAYGSNLHRSDWHRWCEHNGFATGLLELLEPAWLPDWECAFRLESGSRGGGVLDITPCLGQATPGALFEAGFSAWRALDRKEGYPHVYRRREVSVICADGRERRAQTYCVHPARRSADALAPAPGYAELVRGGLVEHGLPTDLLDAAAAGVLAPALIPHVFVYGTLLAGQCREGHMALAGKARKQEAASISGQLENLGAYPGLRLGGMPGARVRGELHFCENLPALQALLSVLDGVEGFHGYDQDDGLYRRTLALARRADGEQQPAWTYRLGDRTPRAPLIGDGDWLAHFART